METPEFIDTSVTIKCSEYVVQFKTEGKHINAKGTYNYDGNFPNLETWSFVDENDVPVKFGITKEYQLKIHIEVELNEKYGGEMYSYHAAYNSEVEHGDY